MIICILGNLGNVAADESTTAPNINVIPDQDWCGVDRTLKCTLKGSDNYLFSASFLNSSNSPSGTIYPSSGRLSGLSHDQSINIKAPLISGDYALEVKFFDDKLELVGTKKIPIKVVDPIELKFTLKNNSNINVSLPIFLKIDGKKMEDNVQIVSIGANNTEDVYYHLFTKNVNNTGYSLEINDKANITISNIEKKFYTSDNNYFIIGIIAVTVLVIILMILLRIYQEPVRNTGKPRGRR